MLRIYQQKAVNAAIKKFEDNNTALWAMATGCGKTITFLGLLNEILSDSRAMIIAHREELIFQAVEKAREFYPNLYKNMGIVMADFNDINKQIVVGTVQTISRRLSNIKDIKYLIIDEAHHTPANSYIKIIEHLRKDNENLKILGVTATPSRSDKKEIGDIFNDICYEYSINDGIADKILCDVLPYGIKIPVSITKVKKTGGDYNAGQLGNILTHPEVEKIIYDQWLDKAFNRPTLIFTATVEQSISLVKYFKNNDIRAEHIDGTTPTEQRRKILSEYQSGELRIVINCMVLTEGFDAPHTAAVFLARPTRSKALFQQCVGRGLRICKDKQDCVIIDFKPEEGHDLDMLIELSKPKLDLKPQSSKQTTITSQKKPTILHNVSNLIVEELSKLTNLDWYHENNVYTFDINFTDTVMIISDNGLYRLIQFTKKTEYSLKYPIFSKIFDALSEAMSFVKTLSIAKSSYRKASWKYKDISLKQQDLLRSMGIHKLIKTAGEASKVISHNIALNSYRKYKEIINKAYINPNEV